MKARYCSDSRYWRSRAHVQVGEMVSIPSDGLVEVRRPPESPGPGSTSGQPCRESDGPHQHQSGGPMPSIRLDGYSDSLDDFQQAFASLQGAVDQRGIGSGDKIFTHEDVVTNRKSDGDLSTIA